MGLAATCNFHDLWRSRRLKPAGLMWHAWSLSPFHTFASQLLKSANYLILQHCPTVPAEVVKPESYPLKLEFHWMHVSRGEERVWEQAEWAVKTNLGHDGLSHGWHHWPRLAEVKWNTRHDVPKTRRMNEHVDGIHSMTISQDDTTGGSHSSQPAALTSNATTQWMHEHTDGGPLMKISLKCT